MRQTYENWSIALRSIAILLLLTLTVVANRMIRNKRSYIYISLLSCILLYAFGTLVLLLQLSRVINISRSLTALFGTSLLVIASELYNWVLFFRFRNVALLTPRLIRRVKIWLIFESFLSAVLAFYWIIRPFFWDIIFIPSNVSPAKMYIYLNVIQTATSVLLGAYFIYVFYWPTLRKRHQKHQALKWHGLIYLIFEPILHLAYSINQKGALPLPGMVPLCTGVNSVCHAIRILLFLCFLRSIRSAVSIDNNASPSQQLILPSRMNSTDPSSDATYINSYDVSYHSDSTNPDQPPAYDKIV